MKLRVDSPVIQAGIKLTNLLILNLYWVIGCLPILMIYTTSQIIMPLFRRIEKTGGGDL